MREAEGPVVPGVAWYRREQWVTLRALAADPEVLEPTYDDWLHIAEQALVTLHQAGIEPRRLDVDVFALKRWCEEQGLALDQAARSEYAAHLLASGRGTGQRRGRE